MHHTCSVVDQIICHQVDNCLSPTSSINFCQEILHRHQNLFHCCVELQDGPMHQSCRFPSVTELLPFELGVFLCVFLTLLDTRMNLLIYSLHVGWQPSVISGRRVFDGNVSACSFFSLRKCIFKKIKHITKRDKIRCFAHGISFCNFPSQHSCYKV